MVARPPFQALQSPTRAFKIVIPGLVPGIHLSTRSGARGWLDPGDKHRDDGRRFE